MNSLALESQPTANLGVILGTLWSGKSGQKIRSTWINNYALEMKRRAVGGLEIPVEVAVAYRELKDRGQIPPWVEMLTDDEAMELAAIG